MVIPLKISHNFNFKFIFLNVKKGEALISKGHPKSGEIRRQVRMLQEHWEKLKRAVAARGKMLEDSRDFLEFLQKVDQVEAWIREKASGFYHLTQAAH